MKFIILSGLVLAGLVGCASPNSETKETPKQTEVENLKSEIEGLKAQLKDAEEYSKATHDHCESTIMDGTAKPGAVEYYQMTVADSPVHLCEQWRADCDHEDMSK